MPDFMNDIFPYVMVLSILAAVVYLCMIYPIMHHFDNKKAMKKMEEDTDTREPEFVSTGAKVLGKGGFSHAWGSNAAHYEMIFRVAFLTDSGEELVFDVPGEVYDRISEGQHGDLVTVNGNFFDFGDGETVPESEEAEK